MKLVFLNKLLQNSFPLSGIPIRIVIVHYRYKNTVICHFIVYKTLEIRVKSSEKLTQLILTIKDTLIILLSYCLRITAFLSCSHASEISDSTLLTLSLMRIRLNKKLERSSMSNLSMFIL